MPALPTGTVTFLFTDIQGSTPLWEHEPEQMRAALARHDALLRAAIEAHGGQVYKLIGDAFQAAFSDAGAALAAAIGAQRALAAEAWPTSVPVCVRMGLHLGPAEAAGSDYATTHTLNRVARLMSVGHGGQIVVSLAVAEAVRGGLPNDCTLRDLGQHRLKGLTQLEHLFQAAVPDLPSDFPPLASLDTRRHNLPTPLTSFVGRARELGEVQGLLAASRLLTLSGPGGAGKTRLAVQLAWAVWESLPGGAWLVELAPLADGALVLPAVAAALGLREQPGRPLLDVLADHLHTRRLLLILDNCEHLVTACAQAADQLLRAGPGVQVLATSREALGITGETAYRVPSLSLPDGAVGPEGLDRSEAVQLFMQRARAALPGFALNEHNAAHIAQICRRLDGIPLALELAASRVKLLRVDQIAARLDDRFRLLTGGSRTALPRQQTLRALIDWSYDLLAPAEAALLRALSVFAGGWTLEAAEAVGAPAVGDEEVLDTLAVLVDKSLVNTGRDSGEDARYTLLETIRQYANEKLLAAAEAAAARDRHLAYFRQWAEAAEPHLFGADEAHWLTLLELEHDNLRAALGWGVETDPEPALSLVVASFWFWERRGYSSEDRQWLTEIVARVQALPLPPVPATAQERQRVLGTALVQLGGIAMTRGETTRSLDLLEASLPLLRAAGARGVEMVALALAGLLRLDLGQPEAAQKHIDAALAARLATGSRAEVAMGLHWLAQYTVKVHGDFETGRAQMLESIQIFRDVGSQWGAALSLMGLGSIAEVQGKPDEAAANLRQAMEVARMMGDRFRANQSLSALADVARHAGRMAEAGPLYREAIVEWQALSIWVAVAEIMEYMAYVAAAQAQPQRAACLLGAAEALRVSLGTHLLPHDPAEHKKALAALGAALGAGAFEAEWAAGRALTREQAVAYAAAADDV